METKEAVTYTVWFWREGEARQQVDGIVTDLGAYAAAKIATGEEWPINSITKEGRNFWAGSSDTFRVEVQKYGAAK